MDWVAYMEHLQAALKEFDPTADPNEETLIRYFQNNLYLSIWAQMDNQRRDLDAWEEVMEKVKAKAGLQPPSRIRKIDSICPKKYKPSIKKDKNDAYWEHCNEASNKNQKG